MFLNISQKSQDHLSFDHDVETHEQTINTAQVDWRETTRTRSIQEITCNSEDEEMMVGNEESDDEVEKVLVEPKPIEVLELLQKFKSFAINSSDAKLTERFEYLYKHAQEMSISAKKQTAIESYFR